MVAISNIWGTLEPILLGLQFLFRLRFLYHSKLTEKQFEYEANRAYEEVKHHLSTFGVKDFFFGKKERYIRQIGRAHV